MSSAANHRKRSHRSYARERSALGNMARRAVYRADEGSSFGKTLLQRLAHHKKMFMERRRAAKEGN